MSSADKPETGRTCKECGGTGVRQNMKFCYCWKDPAQRKPEAGRTCEPSGLYRKFVVERTNGSSGPGGKHEHCDYFVLDWMHDKFAIPAALAYAKACEAEYPELARDLRDRAGAAVAHAEPARKVPLNPAPRPVEQGVLRCDSCGHTWGSPTVNLLTCGVRLTGNSWCKGTIRIVPGHAYEMRPCTHAPGKHPDNCDGEVESQPRPVERCSCEEATSYKAALESVLARCSGFESVPVDQIVAIARRALALGGEET